MSFIWPLATGFETSIAMLIGYARVSTIEQSLDLQVDALKEAGCGKVYEDVASGAQASRPGLAEAMQYFRAGDTLVVWRLGRLERSLSHLIKSIRDGIVNLLQSGQSIA